MDEIKEALTELGLRLHFFAAETSQGFYFGRTTWYIPRAPEDVPHRGNTRGIGLCVEDFPFLAYREVCANILYRKAFASRHGTYRREAAYCLALYKYTPSERLVILERDLETVLARLPTHGYTGCERWLAEDYIACHHFLTPAHQHTIWTSHEFGIALP